MVGQTIQCVERYCELAKTRPEDLKKVTTPCIDDHQFSPDDFENKGALAPIDARVVLKALYTATATCRKLKETTWRSKLCCTGDFPLYVECKIK